MALTYKKTGVDISGIKSTHKGIGRIISSTHDKSVRHGFGHYAGIVRAQGIKERDIAVHTDGVGTKVLIAGMMKKYDTIGIDCMGMNVNDMICTGAAPVAFVDYIAANRNDSKIFLQIAKGLAKGAKISGTPIVGGETAIMPDMFASRIKHVDLAPINKTTTSNICTLCSNNASIMTKPVMTLLSCVLDIMRPIPLCGMMFMTCKYQRQFFYT